MTLSTFLKGTREKPEFLAKFFGENEIWLMMASL